MTVVHRASHDVNFYVVGAKNENELILVDVLTSFFEACQVSDLVGVCGGWGGGREQGGM